MQEVQIFKIIRKQINIDLEVNKMGTSQMI